MKKKHIFYLSILIIGILVYIITHNSFIILKNKTAISDNIEESKLKGTYIKTFKIIRIENLNACSEFPIENVWIEYPWHWDKDMYIFKKVIIDSLESKHIIFEIKDLQNSLQKRDYLKNWIIKSSDGQFVGIYQNIVIILENSSKSYTIYKTKEEYKFTEESLIPYFKFELSMD